MLSSTKNVMNITKVNLNCSYYFGATVILDCIVSVCNTESTVSSSYFCR